MVKQLTAAGHDTLRSVDVLGGGVDDDAVFRFACDRNRVVLTYNNADFIELASKQPKHSGILLVYQDNTPNDMKTTDIVRAIANVDATYPKGIAGEALVLNGFRW
jgi:hypothetical protein